MPPLPPSKLLLRFLVCATACFVLLIIPWPGLTTFYGQAYRRGAELLFRHFGSRGAVAFLPATAPNLPRPPGQAEHADTCILCMQHKDGRLDFEKTCSVWNDSRLTSYLPTVKLIALILATPVAWTRRWSALFWGLVLIHMFIAARLGLTLLHTYTQPLPCRMWTPGPTGMALLGWLKARLASSTLPTFMAPVLIWVLVTLRPEDIRTFTGQPALTTASRPKPKMPKK